MNKLHVASSRTIGALCLQWARGNLPDGWEIEDSPDRSDVFISVMYGSLVSEEFIAKRRCYNFHPGVLPAYRGSGAFSWAIINGEKRTGVTLHELDVDIDTGPVIRIETFPIEAWDTSGTLFGKAMDLMLEMFKVWLPRLLARTYGDPCPQERMGRAHTYYRKDLIQVADLSRYVRALDFAGKPGAFYVDGQGKKIELKW